MSSAAAPSPAPIEQPACYAHRHMTLEEYGLWTDARDVSHGSGVFYFSGRAVAKHFRATRKHAIYRVSKSLLDSGWFEEIKESERDRMTGIYRAAEYRPLSHEEWAGKHPGQCLTCPEPRTGANPETGLASPESWTGTCPENQTGDDVDQSVILNSPVRNSKLTSPETRTQSYKEQPEKENLKKDKARKGRALAFVPPDWIPLPEWNAYLEMRRVKRKPATVHACEIAVKKLQELRKNGDEPGAVLNESILNDWTGVFPLKRNGNGNKRVAPRDLGKIDYMAGLELKEDGTLKF